MKVLVAILTISLIAGCAGVGSDTTSGSSSPSGSSNDSSDLYKHFSGKPAGGGIGAN